VVTGPTSFLLPAEFRLSLAEGKILCLIAAGLG